MADSLTDQILARIEEAEGQYYRLVLVVGQAGSGKTAALQAVASRTGAPLVNVNLELSRQLLELTEPQRALQAGRLMSEIVELAVSRHGPGRPSGAPEAQVVLLDNIELLFDVRLKQDPLRMLQGLSRNRTVVAAWNGTVIAGRLSYAAPGHPEYKVYPARDFLFAPSG